MMHEYSAGNVDAAIKLYMQAQRIAINGETYGGKGIIDADVLRAAACSDELYDVLARLHLEHQWEMEKQIKRTDSPHAAKPVSPKTSSTQSSKKSSSKGSKKEGGLMSLEDRNLIVKPTDEF